MYFRESLRREGILNIFTDASQVDGTNIVSPGYIAVTTQNNEDVIVDKRAIVLENSTNNNGEIRAISLALHYAALYKGRYEYINLFADSLLCINTLREWIYSWMKMPKYDSETKEKILLTGSGTPVANQSEIIGCLRTIIMNNLNVCLYHIKGHVTSTEASLNNALKVFIKSNYFSPDSISIDDIVYLCTYNNAIDEYTTSTLELYNPRTIPLEKVLHNSVYSGINLKKYAELTNNKILKKGE